MSETTMLEIGNSQYNVSSLHYVRGGPDYCEMVYKDFVFYFSGDEAAQIWAWWEANGPRP
jgi:hypothetical protein